MFIYFDNVHLYCHLPNELYFLLGEVRCNYSSYFFIQNKSLIELCSRCNNQTIIIPKTKLDAIPSIMWLRRTLAMGINGFSKISPEICGIVKKSPTRMAVHHTFTFEPRIMGIAHRVHSIPRKA